MIFVSLLSCLSPCIISHPCSCSELATNHYYTLQCQLIAAKNNHCTLLFFVLTKRVTVLVQIISVNVGEWNLSSNISLVSPLTSVLRVLRDTGRI